MFLRKLMVIVCPVALFLLWRVFVPLVAEWGFFGLLLQGLSLGVVLALILPISGAVRKREPFALLLWVPCLLAVGCIAWEGLLRLGIGVPGLPFLAEVTDDVIRAECAFAAFLATTCLRCVK